MESIAFICVLAFATGCIAVSIWHEFRWRSRLVDWKRTKGRVVNVAQERGMPTIFGGRAVSHDGPWPEITFEFNGKAETFISDYGGTGTPKVGTEVDVVFDPETGKAEWISLTNRWLFTVVPIIFGAVFYWIGFNTNWGDTEEDNKQNKAEMATPRKPSD